MLSFARVPFIFTTGQPSERVAVRRPGEIEIDETIARRERTKLKAVTVAKVNLFGIEDGHGREDRRD